MSFPVYNEVELTANGSIVDFDFEFPVVSEDEITVFTRNATTGELVEISPTVYSVLNVDSGGGGTVRFDTAPASGLKVLIISTAEYEQPFSIHNQGGFNPRVVEGAINRLQRQIQQLQKEVSRSVRGVPGESFNRLPAKPLRAGKSLYFNSDGDLAVQSSSTSFFPGDSDGVTHTPAAPHTYLHTLYQDLEWNRPSLNYFLSDTQMTDPLDNDCWQSLQYWVDAIRDSNFDETVNPVKHADLQGRAVRCSETLVITGLQVDVDSMRRGRIILCNGTIVAPDDWEDQTTNPSPLIHFGQYAQGSGMRDVYLDCNGVCSGVLIEQGVSASKVHLWRNRITNFANPQKPLQSNLYSNLVNINTHGGTNLVSERAVRKYEQAGAPHPYGVRLGPEDVTDDTANSMTCHLSGNHISQWEFGRPEALSFAKRTGIGVWLCASDCYLSGEVNNISDVLKSLVIEGHSNRILAYHCSPSGEASEYNVDDGPISTVELIGTENRDGMNYFVGCYHERMLWCHDPAVEVVGCSFPRNDASTDGNTVAITFDADQVDDHFLAGKPNIGINQKDTSLEWYRYREADGNTWNRKAQIALMGDDGMFLNSSTHNFVTGDDAGKTVARFLSANEIRSMIEFAAETSSVVMGIGIENDLPVIQIDGVTIATFAATVASHQYLATALAKTDDTLADVFTAVALEAAKKYAFRAVLYVTAGATGGHKYQVTATTLTVTETVYHVEAFKDDDGSGTPILYARKTALGSASGDAGDTGIKAIIEGTLLVNVAGTINIQFAQNVTDAGASTVLAGSSFDVWELT